jgi:hypothetical protein
MLLSGTGREAAGSELLEHPGNTSFELRQFLR